MRVEKLATFSVSVLFLVIFAVPAFASSCPISQPVPSTISSPISNTSATVVPSGATQQNGSPNLVSLTDRWPLFSFTRTSCTSSPTYYYQILVDGSVWVDNILDYGGGEINEPDRYVKYSGDTIFASARGDSKKLAGGTHNWKIRTYDYQSSSVDSIETSFIIDTTLPELSILRVGDFTSPYGLTDKVKDMKFYSSSPRPKVEGITEGHATVIVMYTSGSSQRSCNVEAGTDGRFYCLPNGDLITGSYDVKVTSTKTSGLKAELPVFKLTVSKGVNTVESSASQATSSVSSQTAIINTVGSISLKKIGSLNFNTGVGNWYYTNLRPVFSGTAGSNAEIKISSDDTVLSDNLKADSSGEFRFKPSSALSEGTHLISIRSSDGSQVSFNLTLNRDCSTFPSVVNGNCTK